MGNKNTADKFARGIAIISLLVSIGSILVPYLQQNSALDEQKRQFQVLQKEDLTVSLDPRVDGQLRVTSRNFGPLGYLVQIPWGVTLSNAGNQKFSLVKYSITTGSSPSASFYSGIDGGVFSLDYKPVEFPLVLEPGESRFCLLYVGLLIPKNVYEELSSIKGPDALTVSYAITALARKGLDIYGNKVDFQEFSGGGFVMTIDEANQKSPTFWFQAITGRGNVFLTSAATYQRTE